MDKVRFRTIIAGLIVIISMPLFAQVAINTDGSAAASSAMLDVNSTTRGFLPPRLALTAADVASPVESPATGLLVFNSQTSGTGSNQVVPGYYSWNGTRWIPVSPQGGLSQGDMAYWNGTAWVIIPAGSYGQSLIFCNGVPTWGGCPALLSTNSISLIQPTAASVASVITSEGGTTVTARGVCWDTIPDPTIAARHTLDGSGSGEFHSVLSGLTGNKTYYVRSYATNQRGVTYGPQQILKTPESSSAWKP